ncbi:MAG TPA: saccharopine dehydrogenase NADP-binding domain-containing protein [Longimicrobiaceae bacterium]|nr:saccharopine dehydrogenase NADP-binding domain-containing protein [Longimicrobiaceae bacterium]
MPPDPFLLYGSYGYTGRLIAERALERGLRPVLAGRSEATLRAQADALGLPWRVVALDDPAALDRALADIPAVVHAAGPFSRTARPMAEACLRTGTHYLDITGEIAVFESLAARDAEARATGVMLLPGAGFDVVPTDCLAAHLARRLPGAVRLALAFHPVGGGVSHGTATTMVENLASGGAVRRGGRIVRVPAAYRTRRVDFGRGPVEVTTIPWGDVSTAYHSTGIPDVEVYTRVRASARRMMVASRRLGWLLGSGPVQRFLKRRIDAAAPGPTPEQRAGGRSLVWGEVEDARGGRAAARMETPEGYTLTAMTAVAAAEEVLAGRAEPGFRTPSLAFGPDWILGFEGVRREDLA